ncbi:glycosyltransferase family 4 protein [Arthrobacter sp. MYb222]|uniref:glycosyltransferase family 4 protein n=1 Tax=Arthrobacter sp. MYb222 TaxID=1848599 RepID=UPI000CFDE464|nr:glycosyltransferase family 4 protein [Arthrobacter sp. MYb222]PQZ83529.1 glycosyltransferase WbuB [Arthrobacter sp. MYb222]
MKIMLLTHSFTPEVSPPQRRWSVIVDELANLGHEVTVVTPASKRELTGNQLRLLTNRNIRVRRHKSLKHTRTMLGKMLKHGIDALISFPAALRVGCPDIVVATVPALPTMVVGYVVAKIYRVPFVVDLRDAWPDLLSESNVIRFSWLEPLITRALGYVVKRSDLLVTVTRGLAKKMVAGGVRNVATIPNGVEVERVGIKVSDVPLQDKLNVLYLGNIGRSQGLETVIRAAALASDLVNLRIVGTGTEKQRLIQLADDLNVEIDFRESVYGEAVLENYSWADTCIVSLRPDWPSFEHTIPSKLYELLFLDQHITAMVRGEAAEVVRASGAGIVVEQNVNALAKHLQWLVEHPKELQTDNHGSTWVRANASLRDSGKRYSELLKQLAGE